MPPKTRALFISSRAWEKLGNDRRTPGSFSESTENGLLSPKVAAKIPAAAALTVECPEGYSGKLGVIPGGTVCSKGIHAGSATVAGLPSRLARTIAVMGRQNT